MRRARFIEVGAMAIDAKAWGGEFNIFGGGGGSAPPPFARVGKAAVVDIMGPLTQRRSWCWDDYESIKARVTAALASDAQAVVMKIDSPGGDAAGVFELSRDLRAAAALSGKRLVAYADVQASSAAYAIACAADAIYLSSASLVGSIGVINALVDQTAMDRMYGLRFAVVASGARKADGNPHVEISEGAIAQMQAQVDGLASLFFELVAEQRGLAPRAVQALEGAQLLGASAVAAGLADKVMTWAELLASIETDRNTGSTQTEAKAMAGYDEEMKALKAKLKAEADGGDEKAKKMLASIEDTEKGGESEKKDDDGEGEEKAAASPAEDDGNGDEEKKKEEAKAAARANVQRPRAAASSDVDPVALAERIHALETAAANKADAETRAQLLAKRPDFSAEVKKTLSAASLDVLRNAVETWPKGPARAAAPAAAAQATGTRGDSEGTGAATGTAEEMAAIARHMGGAPKATGVRHLGRSMELGLMTHEQAAKRVVELSAEGAAR